MKNKEISYNHVLDVIAKESKVTILLATVVGSRLYGSNSNESDYDIRFIYIPNELTVDTEESSISYKDPIYDVCGYSLKTALGHIRENKFQIFEMLGADDKNVIINHDDTLKKLKLIWGEYYICEKFLYNTTSICKCLTLNKDLKSKALVMRLVTIMRIISRDPVISFNNFTGCLESNYFSHLPDEGISAEDLPQFKRIDGKYHNNLVNEFYHNTMVDHLLNLKNS